MCKVVEKPRNAYGSSVTGGKIPLPVDLELQAQTYSSSFLSRINPNRQNCTHSDTRMTLFTAIPGKEIHLNIQRFRCSNGFLILRKCVS